jgi:hypothetical protein
MYDKVMQLAGDPPESLIRVSETRSTFLPHAQRNAYRIAVCVNNADRSPVGIRSCDTAPAPTAVFRPRCKHLDVFCNFAPKKPENTSEGISPNYNNPHKGYALPGTK